MSVFGDIWHWLTEDDTQARALPDPDSIEGLTSRIRGGSPGPWRSPSIREALGVPAIFRSVALIANTTGALSLKAYREGRALPEAERPRLIVRPDPFRTPRSFFRDTAYNMATRGEAWWWVAKRDFDGNALSLISVPPAEVTVTEDPDDLRYPVVEWRGRRMKNADMRQITYLQEPGALRGHGPLQMCGAAVSVAVEAQEWAANFYADGGHPSVLIKAAGTLGEDLDTGEHEADILRADWVNRPNNVPRVIDESIEDVGYMQPNVQGAQMLEARVHQIGEAVRMLGVPASLIGYATPGSSLTYQNVGQELDKFTRTCLWPDYLEAIEQEMSDLLTRSTVARFNLDALTRADIKTRYEVYKLGTESGVLDAEEARTMEGLEPGDVENAPMPAAPPQAIPSILPVQGRTEVRCDGTRVFRDRLVPCNKLLAESGAFTGRCPRCKKEHAA